KQDSASTTVTTTVDAAPAEKLIEALAADKLIDKDNFTLSLSKGKLILDEKEQTADVVAKYKSLIDALGNADLNIKNTKK
ncbi:MAG TPA: hypothetical protein PLY26_13105, partial [Ferruginibacter sp.]|nr:hypothetical protein [Ferruginibacter sp.]